MHFTSAFRLLSVLTLFPHLPAAAQAPDGPPGIEPTPLDLFQPEPLGARIIPPFIAEDPGGTVLVLGQTAELQVVFTDADGVVVRWIKDGEALPGSASAQFPLPRVETADAGTYQVEISFGGQAERSTETVFEVVPQSEVEDVFDTWVARFFSFADREDPEVSGLTSDPDADGLNNLAEYFFGLQPKQSDPPSQIRMSDRGATGGLTVVYERSSVRPDVVMRVEGSDSLWEWVSLSTDQVAVTPLNNATEQVTLEVDWSFSTAYPRFLRLSIERRDP